MTRSLGFALLWLLLGCVASLPLWYTLPEPDAALALHEVQRIDASGNASSLQLPLARLPPDAVQELRAYFRPANPDDTFLFIPLLSQRVVVKLNGVQLVDSQHRTALAGLASGVATLVRLPVELLVPGENLIELRLSSSGSIPSYLSPLYIGSAEQLAPHYRIRVFVLEYLKLMAFAGQLLITLVVAVAWIYRPGDPLFRWLVMLLPLSLVTFIGVLRELVPGVERLTPYATMLSSAAAVLLVGVALLIAERPVPRWLKWLSVAIPLLTILLGLSGLVPATPLAVAVNAPLNILGLLACLCIVTWGGWRYGLTEARFMALPSALAFGTALHDLLVVLRLLDGPVFLSLYYRPLLLIGVAMILMRRLGVSLIALDDVNQYLKQRLNEQERVLERMYAEERTQAAQRVRTEERQRLTKDLHDGLSGHLVSIIALSEREQAATIEHSAREALDDLRLVINSLDIGEDELPLALSGLRERLERQLKRLDIVLDWSIVNLPEIAGVTPTHALNVLRILQEAITNAVKHGHARRISVQGSSDALGHGVLTIENDGLPFANPGDHAGHGLANIRRRVTQLGAELQIEALAQGTRLAILFPPRLPPAQ